MPENGELQIFFSELNSSLKSEGKKLSFELLDARLERLEGGGVSVHELRSFNGVAQGDACIMQLKINVGPVVEYTIYVRFDVSKGYELEYKGISLSGRMPFGIMTSKRERELGPGFRSTIANIESWIEDLILIRMESLLTGRAWQTRRSR